MISKFIPKSEKPFSSIPIRHYYV